MGQLAVPLMIASTAFTVASSLKQAGQAEDVGNAQQQVANMQAANARKVAERNALIRSDEAKYKAARQREEAIQKDAVAQQRAKETRRQTAYSVSSARAAGGGSDPTVLDIIGNIIETGEFNAQTDIYNGKIDSSFLRSQAGLTEYQGERDAEMILYDGETSAGLLNYQGSVAKYEGDVKAVNARSAAVGSLISGASSISTKYAPKTTANYSKTNYWEDGSPMRIG